MIYHPSIEQAMLAQNSARVEGASPLIPVLMEQSGGSDGSSTVVATWTYNIKDIYSGETIISALDIIKSTTGPEYYFPHRWRRPPLGKVIKATFGLMYRAGPNRDGEDEWLPLGLVWCNEVSDMAACS